MHTHGIKRTIKRNEKIQEVEKAFQVFIRSFRYILYPHKSVK